MTDIDTIKNELCSKTTIQQLEQYVGTNWLHILDYFDNISCTELEKNKQEIETMFYDLIDNELISEQHNSKFINSLLILLAEKFEFLQLKAPIKEIISYLPKTTPVLNRLKASVLYFNINDVRTGYHEIFNKVMEQIEYAQENEEFIDKTINSVVCFYFHAIEQFTEAKQNKIGNSFKQLFADNAKNYSILNDESIKKHIKSVDCNNYKEAIVAEKQKLLDRQVFAIKNDTLNIKIETSDFSDELRKIKGGSPS
ncbi:MAG: hypothetical protein DRQ51_03220 [Gammaproteobacteria bacterium]|nr:MAG: hypothetical protein DRQ51_03220 [Gammaproteobacteria bacterium]